MYRPRRSRRGATRQELPMSHGRRATLALSHSIAAALAILGAWVALHARRVDSHTVAGVILLAISIMWIVQVHLVQHSSTEAAPATDRDSPTPG